MVKKTTSMLLLWIKNKVHCFYKECKVSLPILVKRVQYVAIPCDLH